MSQEDRPEVQAEGLPIPNRLIYNYAETRQLLGGVPVSTFAQWISEGLVRPVRIGPRRCFVRHEDLVRLAGGSPSGMDWVEPPPPVELSLNTNIALTGVPDAAENA